MSFKKGIATNLTETERVKLRLGGQGVTTIAKSGSTQLSGDVTLSEGTNITLTQLANDIEIAAAGGGDMLKATYDTDNDGRVDVAEGINDGTNSATAAAIVLHFTETMRRC